MNPNGLGQCAGYGRVTKACQVHTQRAQGSGIARFRVGEWLSALHGEGIVNDEQPRDPWQPQGRSQYSSQQSFGQQLYPQGQPQYGQEGTTGQYPGQPPYHGLPHEPPSDGFGGRDMAYETDPPPPPLPSPEPPPKQRPSLVMMLMMGLAIALSAAALTVALLHAGPRGAPGPTGLTGPAGPQGPAGQNAPTLSYTCQMLFPNGSSNGTETTFYWPCTNNSHNG